ncbi:MAG: metal-dependent transcriptional regulator [Desulfobulbaceae bacterium]|uniref:Metal-dependent transcriptional regulator n=1 Tax=Candidatus Desulfobia pelagia TaxID=2841692 RepID=A0A8J6NC41_9BACT|nr:metal-dependent transcriptional regulator [Candidatus Desulfobia pelagia]
MTDEKYDEILESIWKTEEQGEFSDDAIRANCTVPFTDNDLEELVRNDMITVEDTRILFTRTGKKKAERIVRRHRLAEVLVSTILRLKDSRMEEVACKVEHSLLPEVEEAICTLLGHPEKCPDGKPIPPGPCCGKCLQSVETVVQSLADLKPGESGKIMYIKPGSHSHLHHLISFGLNPGVIVTVHRSVPAFCIKFENTELALDEDIVRNIFVWKAK